MKLQYGNVDLEISPFKDRQHNGGGGSGGSGGSGDGAMIQGRGGSGGFAFDVRG